MNRPHDHRSPRTTAFDLHLRPPPLLDLSVGGCHPRENILTVVAAPSNVVRLNRTANSGHTRYADNPPLAFRKVKK